MQVELIRNLEFDWVWLVVKHRASPVSAKRKSSRELNYHLAPQTVALLQRQSPAWYDCDYPSALGSVGIVSMPCTSGSSAEAALSSA